MLISLIQKQVPVGGRVKFTLKNDKEISGTLERIEQNLITVKDGEMLATFPSETVVLFESFVDPELEKKVQSDGTEADKNISDEVAKKTVLPPINSEEVVEKLSAIQARFNEQSQNFEIELKDPDFTFPAEELSDWQETDAAAKWNKIKNIYEYAQKNNELSPQFDRVQGIVSELKSLTERFPNSLALKRHLAYFYSLSGNRQAAIHIYQEVVITSEDANDWFNMAVSALKLNQQELACYSLEKFFYTGSISDEPKAWSAYVSLLEKFNNYQAFRELCKTDQYGIEEKGIKILLETAIYLLKKTSVESLGETIIQKWLTGKSIKSLLGKACQKLDGQPVESYSQFLAKFMKDMIAIKNKPVPITPERPKPFNLVKQTIRRKTPPKLKTQRLGNPYASAKQADYEEKDLEKAENLYREAIRRNIRRESAIKDLAMLLTRLDRAEEAMHLLEQNRQKVEDKQSYNNLLITTVYPKAGQYKKAIALLNDNLKQTSNEEKKSQILWQLSSVYIKSGDYTNAESQLRQALKIRPDNITVQRNLALCLSKQERYNDAEEILNRIQDTSPDLRTAELLEAIERAKTEGEPIRVDDIIIETELSDELSEFAKFFLNRWDFTGIQRERIKDGQYTGSKKDCDFDIKRLGDLAKTLGTRHARERSNCYLSLARIYLDMDMDRNLFYRYLCRSFASRGDTAVSEYKENLSTTKLDTAREWYYEALRVYDRVQDSHYDEQDAVNALSRFLFSYLGSDSISTSPYRRDEKTSIREQQVRLIENTVKVVISCHRQKDKAFDAIGYLVRSGYAANRILPCLYNKQKLQEAALQYLKNKGITHNSITSLYEFTHLWGQLRSTNFDQTRIISTDLRFLRSNFELTTASLEHNINLVSKIHSQLFFDLDRQRVSELQKILETALELCNQVTFEEQERLYSNLDNQCQTLFQEVEESPTKLSVEDVYPITKIIQQKVNDSLENLYETSKPQLTLRLAVESYVPDNNRKIEVQIVVQNERGRSPAESLELMIEGDQEFFSVTESEIKRDESLRGGEQAILMVPLHVTDKALESQTFSLPFYARYRTRNGEQEETSVENLSVRLYSEDEFEDIENPYAGYAEGGIVGDPAMFFGRKELIQNIAGAIQTSRLQSKCIMVFGQKRSGKSSVLYHLKTFLQKDKGLLILDLGNIGTLRDPEAPKPLLYQFLNRILTILVREIKRKQRDGFSPLGLSIPGKEFYEHPAPLQCFEDIFEELKELVSNQEDWDGVRVVLLIDEFQYIYDQIVSGEIPESFMQNWKAILQANYFNAVLVGQDVMPKFKARFPNEFGTTQDERVTYLKPDDARSLIDEPIRIGGRQGESRYREQAIERILDLTAGSPFYIQIICDRLVKYMNNKCAGLVTKADVEQVKNELIRDVNALDDTKFDNLINSGDTSEDAISNEDALKVLKAIADNSRTGPCHRDRIDCETSFPVDTILADLEKRDVVKRREQSYQIQVGLFKEWLMANG